MSWDVGMLSHMIIVALSWNKINKLQATLVRNYHRPSHLLTGVKCSATNVAKKLRLLLMYNSRGRRKELLMEIKIFNLCSSPVPSSTMIVMIAIMMVILMVIIKINYLWSTPVPSRHSTTREFARPCLNDNNDDDDYHHQIGHNDSDNDVHNHDEDDHLPCSLTKEAMAAG